MIRLGRRQLLLLGIAILSVMSVAVLLTALSGRMIKAYLEKGSDRNFRIERISFGWGTIRGDGIHIFTDGHEVATAKLVTIRPSLLTLFRKGFTLSKVIIDEPTFTLDITSESHLKIHFPTYDKGERRSEPQSFRVGALEINNGILTINDSRPGKPAQSHIHNMNVSLAHFSYPLSDEPSTLNASASFSGKILSGRISSSGTLNLKTGAIRLVCAAQDLKALQFGSQAPRLHVEKLSFQAESTGLTPLTIANVRIENPHYQYSAGQKQEITNALPPFGHRKQNKHESVTKPLALIKGIVVEGGEIVITDAAASRNASPISIINMSLSLDQLALPLDDTSSRFDLSGRIPGRQHSASLRWFGKTSFGSLETDSRLSVLSLDLTTLKPYLEKKGDISVSAGTVDVKAHIRIHDRYLDTPVTATIRKLELAPVKGFRDQVMGVPRSMLLDMMKTKNDELQLDFVVSGSLDNPNFSLRENLAKRFAVALARSLGLSSVVGSGEAVIQQGARAIQGAGKGIKGLSDGVRKLFGK